MATKTLILRPTSVTCDDESKIALYPSETTMSNAHMLVNEEIADDDATYTTITGVGGKINYYFTYEKPSDLLNITDIVVKAIEKLESGSDAGSAAIYVDDRNFQLLAPGALSTSNYIELSFTAGVNSLFDAFSNADSDSKIYVSRQSNTNSSKTSQIRTTQIYIEITYEAKEPNLIYLKKDGTYALINYGSIYFNTNSSWELSDLSVLKSSKKYIIKEVE